MVFTICGCLFVKKIKNYVSACLKSLTNGENPVKLPVILKIVSKPAMKVHIHMK